MSSIASSSTQKPVATFSAENAYNQSNKFKNFTLFYAGTAVAGGLFGLAGAAVCLGAAALGAATLVGRVKEESANNSTVAKKAKNLLKFETAEKFGLWQIAYFLGAGTISTGLAGVGAYALGVDVKRGCENVRDTYNAVVKKSEEGFKNIQESFNRCLGSLKAHVIAGQQFSGKASE